MPVEHASRTVEQQHAVRHSTAAQSPKPARQRPVANSSRKLSWDRDRTNELFFRCRAYNDTEAREELVCMYLNLVYFLAGKFRNRGEAMDDLIQVGTIGLIKAIDRFDTGRGLEFTTYASPTILGEIKRHFRDRCWAMKVPRRLQELSTKVNRAVDELTRQLQRSPTIPEIAEHLDVSTEDVLDAMETTSAYSLAPLESSGETSDGDEYNLLDVLGDEDSRLDLVEDRATLAALLDGIPANAQRILYLRFFEGLTQTEIAKEMRISQMQVSRVLRKTLPTLRQRLIAG